jgi:amino acid adenylation domain-containing protein
MSCFQERRPSNKTILWRSSQQTAARLGGAIERLAAAFPYVSVHLAVADAPALEQTREMASAAVNACRASAGLPAVDDPFGASGHSSQLSLYALSRHLLPEGLQWPEHHKAIGFLLSDVREQAQCFSPGLDNFPAAGEPPVVIDLGGIPGHTLDAANAAIIEGAKLSGCPTIIMDRSSRAVHPDLPGTILRIGNSERRRLFPGASLIVHDGSLAVSAAAFYAGIPSVVVLPPGKPSIWAELARKKGCAKHVLPLTHLNASRMAAAIKGTLASREISKAAQALGEQMRTEKAAEAARKLIEALVLRKSPGFSIAGGAETATEPARVAGRGTIPPLVPAKREGDLPLSYAQQQLWLVQQLEPESSTYNMDFGFRIQGELDREILRQSIGGIVRRHEVLRMRFHLRQGRPVVQIAESSEIAVEEIDLRGMPPEDRDAAAIRQLQQQARVPFDLQQAVLRVTLWRLDEHNHVLLISAHHIVADGWSLEIFIQELSEFYDSFSLARAPVVPELPVQYLDFSIWQRSWLQGELLEEQLEYWKERLKGLEPLELPVDHPRPSMISGRGAHLPVRFSADLAPALKTLARNQQTTLFMVLMAALQVLLGRYARQEDVAVGTAIANRQLKDLEKLIGMFVNTLVLRTDLSSNPAFQQLLERVKRVALNAYAHQEVPFEKVVEALRPSRDRSRATLFQVMLVLEGASKPKLRLGTATLSPIAIENLTSKFELLLTLRETTAGIAGSLEYSTDLFESATMARMLGHYENLLRRLAGASGAAQRIGDIPLLSETEHHQLLMEWNRTERPFARESTLHGLFEQQVMRHPDAIALVCGRQSMTYEELNRRADRLGHYLRKSGVGPEVRVGICAERTIELVVALLGVLKAGGAYVPLDPAYPRERLIYMLQDSEARFLLTQQHLSQSLPEFGHCTISIDSEAPEPGDQTPIEIDSGVLPQNLAYLIYTSGSTGRPKGVMITHQNVVNFLHWARDIYKPPSLHRVLAATSICFDLSIFELFLPLICGGSVKLIENILQLVEAGKTDEISLINTVPSALSELIKVHELPESVRRVNLAGEELPPSLVQQLYRYPGIEQVVNLYGPSESTTYSTYMPVPREQQRTIPIGVPIANTQIFILSEHLLPVPVGVTGEIYIAGAGLSRGYWKRPELTAERFIPHPHARSIGEHIYRTGDLGRYRSDGVIEFLGRIDHQVKIRGYRIELGEIESVLVEEEQVEQAAVSTYKESQGGHQLVAYIVVRQGAMLEEASLREALRRKLPEYMVPAIFIHLNSFPLNSNGKLDRRALPPPKSARPELTLNYVPPRTQMEHTLSRIWGDALGVQRVGLTSNFFDLGGHSLLAVRLVNDMNMAGLQCSLRDLHDYPTIESLLRHTGLSALEEQPGSSDNGGDFPLLPVQMRQMPAPGKVVTRLVPVCIEMTEPVKEAVFIQALDLWYRQDIFRLRFKKEDSEWRQFYQRPSSGDYAPIHEYDIDDVADEEQLVREAVAICRTFIPAINIFTGPAIQIALLRKQKTISHMLWLIDHLFVDNISLSLLLNSLRAMYQQVLRRNCVVIAPDTVICRWAEHLSRLAEDESVLRQYGFWESHFTWMKHSDAPQIHAGKGDLGRIEADHAVDALDREQTEKFFLTLSLQKLSFEEICLGNFLWAYKNCLNQDMLLLAMANSGRDARVNGIDLSRGLGSFALFYPALFRLDCSLGYKDFMTSVIRQHRSYSGKKETYSVLRFLNQETGKQLQERENWAPSIIFNCLGMGATGRRKTEEVFTLSTAWRKVANAFAVDQDQAGTHYSPGFPRRGITFVGSDDSLQISLLFYKDDAQQGQLRDIVKQTKEALLGHYFRSREKTNF